MKTKMDKKQIEKQKAELEKKLQAIKEQEIKDQNEKFKTLLDLCKPEIDEYKSLGTFRSKGKISVELSYELETTMHLEHITEPGSFAEDDSLSGNCYVTPREPKGHNIAQFVCDAHFGNVGVNGLRELSKVSPEAKEYTDRFNKAKKNLIRKVKKSARKLGLDEQECFEQIADAVT